MHFMNKNQMSKKDNCLHDILAFLAFILSIFLVILAISSVVGIVNKIKTGRYIGQDVKSQNTISVSETGEVYASPDLALTNFSVITEAETVAEAMNQNIVRMNNIIASIKDLGVEEKDLKTTTFNIYPRYEYHKEIVYPYGSKRVLVGYEVRQTLQVKIRDLAKISQIIDAAAEAGSNQVGNLQFTIDKRDELEEQARDEAIKKAKGKAKKLAKELGVDLVRISSFSEAGPAPSYYRGYAMAEIATEEIDEAQIEVGENKISVTVGITYEIN